MATPALQYINLLPSSYYAIILECFVWIVGVLNGARLGGQLITVEIEWTHLLRVIYQFHLWFIVRRSEFDLSSHVCCSFLLFFSLILNVQAARLIHCSIQWPKEWLAKSELNDNDLFEWKKSIYVHNVLVYSTWVCLTRAGASPKCALYGAKFSARFNQAH